MAYKYSPRYSNKGLASGPVGKSQFSEGKKALKKGLEEQAKAAEKLRQSSITSRGLAYNEINSLKTVSQDQNFNNSLNDMWFSSADEVARINQGMADGSIDIGEGTAFVSQENAKLNLWGKFAPSVMAVYDEMQAANKMPAGSAGAYNTQSMDFEMGRMIQELVDGSNPNLIARGEGNNMIVEDVSTGRVINVQQFVDAIESGKDLIPTIADYKENTNTAFKDITSNVAEGYLVKEEILGPDGVKTFTNKYDYDRLKEGYNQGNPWLPIIEDPEQADAAWEWAKHNKKQREAFGLKGEWIGDQMDGEGNYTAEALAQQDLLKDALTDYSIRTNVPANDLLEGERDIVTKRTGGLTTSERISLRKQREAEKAAKSTGKLTDKDKKLKESDTAAKANNKVAQQIIQKKYAKKGKEFDTTGFTQEQMIVDALNKNSQNYGLDRTFDIEDGKVVETGFEDGKTVIVSYDNNVDGITRLLNSVSGFKDADVVTSMNTQTFPTLDFEIKNGRIRVVGGKDDPTAGMTKEERIQYYINIKQGNK
jgi:hypothetical protein